MLHDKNHFVSMENNAGGNLIKHVKDKPGNKQITGKPQGPVCCQHSRAVCALNW
jgi:hypothetical protein